MTKPQSIPFTGELVEGSTHWSAADLCALKDRIAAGLAAEGIGPQSRVAIAFEDHARYLTAAWASRGLGAVPVLLSASRAGATRDADRIGGCLIDSEPHV